MKEAYKVFTEEELEKAKGLCLINHQSESTDIGFVHNGTWITTPFMEDTGRFELKDYEGMCNYYGRENVENFIRRILEEGAIIKVTKQKWDSICEDYKGIWQDYHDEHPEWIGRKTVMSGCITENETQLGKLLIEGVHFIIEE